MIAACPKCGARYRIDDGRLPPQGARLRCARCEAVFKIRRPARARPPAAAADGAGSPAVATPAPRAAAAVRAPQPSGSAGERPRPLVLVADSEVESGRATAAALSSWGLQTLLVHDGVEAILSIQRALPCAVVLDAALPKMFGFQICELMKRNESLRHIFVVLVGAIHDRERYRQTPNQLYGADAYVERPQMPAALDPLLQRFRPAPPPAPPRETPAAPPAPLRETPAAPPAPPRETPAPAPRPAAPPSPPARPVAPPPAARVEPPAPAAAPPSPPHRAVAPPPAASRPPAPAAAEAAPPGIDPAEVEKAERLARIVISDIVLYNPEKFEAALAGGNVLEAMADELEEGRNLFRQRVDARVRDTRDFLAQELIRVARQRSGR